MKTILMCLPRTGSTNIRKYFQNSNPNWKVYNEPFNPPIEKELMWEVVEYDKVISNSNVFVKGIQWHIPKELEHLTLGEFYQKLYRDFDRVVILKRRDIEGICKSILNAKTNGVWHGKYVSREFHMEKLKGPMRFMNQRDEDMDIIIKTHNSIVYYYEDIFWNKELMKEFIKDIGSEWNETQWGNYLDIVNRYQVEGGKSIV